MDSTIEQWRVIPGYGNHFQASNLGRIRRKNKDTELKQRPDKDGYLRVCLNVEGKKHNPMVHRLVMLAFVGKSDLTVNHKDENKQNNKLSNLEYMTAYDNLHYGTGIARRVAKKQTMVECYDLVTGETIQTFESVNSTKQYGYTPQNVSHCITGRYKSHCGLGWRRCASQEKGVQK